MGSVTIITIVVGAVLVMAIFGFVWIGYAASLREYKMELDQGKYDIELCHELYLKNHKNNIVKKIGYIMTLIILIILFGLFTTSTIFKPITRNITINGNTALVVKTGSMSAFYNDNLAEDYDKLGYDENLQFAIGDICIFEKQDGEFKIGDVYAYYYKGNLITHRLVGTQEVKDNSGNVVKIYYVFRGDNNPSNDQILVTEDKILYHYTGNKIKAIGNIVLFAQSRLGMWFLLCLLGLIISSDYITHKIQNYNDERLERIGGAVYGQN